MKTRKITRNFGTLSVQMPLSSFSPLDSAAFCAFAFTHFPKSNKKRVRGSGKLGTARASAFFYILFFRIYSFVSFSSFPPILFVLAAFPSLSWLPILLCPGRLSFFVLPLLLFYPGCLSLLYDRRLSSLILPPCHLFLSLLLFS